MYRFSIIKVTVQYNICAEIKNKSDSSDLTEYYEKQRREQVLQQELRDNEYFQHKRVTTRTYTLVGNVPFYALLFVLAALSVYLSIYNVEKKDVM